METLELPVIEELEEQTPPVTFTDREIDLIAFRLWRDASLPEPGEPA